MSQDNYEIRFELLIPKFILFRYDVFPFIFAYVGLFYWYFNLEESEDSNMSIYLRLALIGVGFLNCLAYIFGHWSRKMQAIIQYRKLSGAFEKNLEQASHVYIYQKKQGLAPTHFITDFYKQEEPLLYFFNFLQKKYYYDEKSKTFERLKPKVTNLTVEELIYNGRHQTPRDYYDDNILEIPIREFGDIFREQIIDPFAFFQLFSVFLWMLDSNVTYCIIILVMLLGSSYAISVQRIKTLIGYRSMTLAPHEVYVYEGSKWIPKSSYLLKPGDIISVTAGYQHKKVPHESISDKEYLAKLIPFANMMPQKMMNAANPNVKEDNASTRFVPCDILILGGGCIANESIMTGEAIPQIKESITKEDLTKQFAQSHFKQNILFCGTQILQVNEQYQQEEVQSIIDPSNKEKVIPKPPVNGCIGMVITTGFETSKGKLIRKVIANAQNLKIEQKDGLWIIGFLLICSLVTSAYVLDQGMQNEERSKEKLFLRCILIITTVVPPELPMILTLAVNNSILYLQKKKIFVSEPKKIPLGGKVQIIAFDKTGTLTEDKFIFEGIVDDCQNYKALKNLKTCNHENICVLAGCQSLINVDKELTGDPIELMFFQLSDWTYTSKLKEARRSMEKITINRIYPFKSELKRMSTLVEHVQENGARKYKVLCKGAPEAIEKLLSHVPLNYKSAYEFYTKQGFRLLALASKQANYEDFSNTNNKDKQREIAESGLKFSGFFICNSPLKADTTKNIQNLQKAKYKLLIITGDNILTAIKVGLTLKLGQKAWMIESVDGKVFLNKDDGKGQTEIENPIELENLVSSADQKILLSTSSSKFLAPEYFPLIQIFARTSPHDKEVIIKKIKEIQNCGVLYAGDGSNDVGGLRAADVGVAVVGTTALSEVQEKQQKQKQQEKEYQRKLKQLQNDIAMPFKKKIEAMGNLNKERMMRMRQKNMGFAMDDDIKVGDACIAAPFTSKHSSSIRCVLIIIRQSVATLVTTIQTYKILAISSMLQAYSLAQMNLINLKYSEKQMGFVGILASINFYYFSNAKPLKNISHIRAPNTIFNKYFAISFFGQIIFFVFANYYALNHIGLKYVLEEDKKVSADMEFKKSFLNTVIFLFSTISQSTVFIVNHGGQPHMESLLKNSRYFKFLIIPLVICFVLTANIFPELSEFADLKFDGIPFAAHVEMLIVFGALVASTYFLDRFCRFAQYKEFVGWF